MPPTIPHLHPHLHPPNTPHIPHLRHTSQLTQTLYKKLSKRYLNPTQGINSNLIKNKIHRDEKEVILVTIGEEMGKFLGNLPFIYQPREWMTFGMIKNRMYCRKRGDRFQDSSERNLEKIHSQFIISQYYKKIDAIKKKNKTQRSRSIPANLDKFPTLKNITYLQPQPLHA